MAPGRSLKALASRRRRTTGDDEEDDSATMADDTQSEASVTTDMDQDADAEGDADASDLSEGDAPAPENIDQPSRDASNGNGKDDRSQSKKRKASKAKVENGATDGANTFEHSTDTDVMLNGSAIDFKDTVASDSIEGPPSFDNGVGFKKTAVVADRRRREHEEYKKKRDTDPTFIPNRGGFFMHDARIPEQRGFSSFARGRGKGRGGFGAHVPAGAQMAQPETPSDASWKHDLHETVNAPNNASKLSVPSHEPTAVTHNRPSNGMPASIRPLNFSKSTQIGKVQIRLNLPQMKAPILFPDVPVKSHARLPDHRPPLRRDKPVRISLPDLPPKYRFPSSDRSFIFIPRAMRPNQQGFGRARGGFGGYAMPASRRTSMYGGSVYSSMSRRSSLAREVPRDSAFSPTGSYAGRPLPQAARPVVRLPHGSSRRSSNASLAGSTMAYGGGQSYPLPQKPAVEHWAEPVTMYQPRPQKQISVTGIESPAGLALHAPQQQDQQPFHNQLPNHMADTGLSPQNVAADAAQPPHFAQQYAYPGALSAATPLSNIPERAIHAQPFQPVPSYYPQYPAQGYYYPSQSLQYPSGPMYAPLQPGYAASDGGAAAGPAAELNQVPHGMVAYETNGMVYYQDTTHVTQYPQQDGYYQAHVYGMGGMMTPGPDASNYYYNQAPASHAYYAQS